MNITLGLGVASAVSNNGNPVPSIASLSSASANWASGAQTVTVNGSGFILTSQAQVDGVNVTTSYVSATQLSITIPASVVRVTGAKSVTVINGLPGGGTSSPATYTVSFGSDVKQYFDSVASQITIGGTSEVVAAGTTPPTVTTSGTAGALYMFRVEITTGGSRGTAVFRWSSDNGATYTTGVTTAASVVLGSTGITVAFATGTYATDNVYTFSSAWSAWLDAAGTAQNFNSVNATRSPGTLFAASGPWNGIAPSFDGTNDAMPAGAASDSTYLSDGTGCTWAFAFRPTAASGTSVIFDSASGTTANTGVSVTYNATAQSLSVLIGKGSAGNAVFNITVASVSRNSKHTVVISHSSTASPQYTVRVDGVTSNSGSYTNAPSSSAPTGALTIGGLTSVYTSNFKGEIPRIVGITAQYASSTATLSEIETWLGAA